MRTLYTGVSPYYALSGLPLRPLGHRSGVRGILHALGDEQAADGPQLPAPLAIEPRILQAQAAQRVDDDLRNDQPRTRLVVRGHHVPRRGALAGGAQAGLVSLHVVLPAAALVDVGHAEFPVLLGIVDAREKALALLLLRDVKKELEHARAVAVQVALEVSDRFVALLPRVAFAASVGNAFAAQDLRVHAHDQDLLVVRAVEDADTPALGEQARAAPQEIVLQLLGARVLEAVDLAALRVHAGHHVLDHAVLARGVHGLEDDQQGAAVRGVKHVLQRSEILGVPPEQLLIMLVGLVERPDEGRPLVELHVRGACNVRLVRMAFPLAKRKRWPSRSSGRWRRSDRGRGRSSPSACRARSRVCATARWPGRNATGVRARRSTLRRARSRRPHCARS